MDCARFVIRSDVASLTTSVRPHILISGSRRPGFQDAHSRGHRGRDLYPVKNPTALTATFGVARNPQEALLDPNWTQIRQRDCDPRARQAKLDPDTISPCSAVSFRR